jgi:CO/xanthine dehydrogenase FAD-binding subunit
VKPAPFEYHDPVTVDETLGLLADLGDEAKVLAGGQSLVPLLNFRLARPDHIVDINGVEELDTIRLDDGVLRVGALTRQAVLERSSTVAEAVPLLPEAVRWIGHGQIRNRGTVGGSVVHADPAAELPAALTALEARFHVRSARGHRVVEAPELFVTHLTTSLQPDELLVEIEVPLPPPGTTAAFVEFARRHGDFALGGAAVLVTAAGGVVTRARIGLLAAADTPVRALAAEEALVGWMPGEDAARTVSRLAMQGLAPTGDMHGGAEYRLELLQAMVRRALVEAMERLTR